MRCVVSETRLLCPWANGSAFDGTAPHVRPPRIISPRRIVSARALISCSGYRTKSEPSALTHFSKPHPRPIAVLLNEDDAGGSWYGHCSPGPTTRARRRHADQEPGSSRVQHARRAVRSCHRRRTLVPPHGDPSLAGRQAQGADPSRAGPHGGTYHPDASEAGCRHASHDRRGSDGWEEGYLIRVALGASSIGAPCQSCRWR